MRLDSDDFELFGVPRRFAQDRQALDARWKQLQAQVHPDRFAAEAAAGQRVALQWAVRVNEAYQRLKDPLRRAAYLCELLGVPIDAERNTAMPREFLVEQMEWREALDDANTAEQVEALAGRVSRQRQQALDEVSELLDREHDVAAAAQRVRALMFIERFAHDIDRQLEAMEP